MTSCMMIIYWNNAAPDLANIYSRNEFSAKANFLFEKLTAREKEVLIYFLRGKTAKQTASITNLTYRTIEYYFTNIKRKLNCRYKHDLIAMFTEE